MVQLFGQPFGLETIIFGTTLQNYGYFLVLLLGFLVVGRIAYYILDTYGRQMAKKTKSDVDDLILDGLAFPVRYGFFFLGLLIGGNLFLTPSEGIKVWYDNVISLTGLVMVVYTLIRFVDLFSDRVLRKLTNKTASKLDDQLVPLITRTIKYAIVALAALLALDNFGYDITALLAGLGIGGLAIAFAAQETIKDIFGGLVIFSNKTFFVGDRITVDGVTGKVEAINLRTTLIRNWEGRIVVVPNSKMSAASVENWARAKARRTSVTLQVTYDTTSAKLTKAKTILRTIANETEGVLHDSPDKEEIMVWFSAFGPSSLDIQFIYFVEDQDNILKIWDEVNMLIKKEFERAGIEFAYPTQTVYVKK